MRQNGTVELLAVPLEIHGSGGDLWRLVVTDDSGHYHIDSISNGDYTFAEVTPLGYEADQMTKEFTVNHIPVTVAFTLPAAVRVKLEVFNVMGLKVVTLMDGLMEAGDHQIQRDGLTENGSPAATGIHLYRLQAGDIVETRKMLLVK